MPEVHRVYLLCLEKKAAFLHASWEVTLYIHDNYNCIEYQNVYVKHKNDPHNVTSNS